MNELWVNGAWFVSKLLVINIVGTAIVLNAVVLLFYFDWRVCLLKSVKKSAAIDVPRLGISLFPYREIITTASWLYSLISCFICNMFLLKKEMLERICWFALSGIRWGMWQFFYFPNYLKLRETDTHNIHFFYSTPATLFQVYNIGVFKMCILYINGT